MKDTLLPKELPKCGVSHKIWKIKIASYLFLHLNRHFFFENITCADIYIWNRNISSLTRNIFFSKNANGIPSVKIQIYDLSR